MTTALRWTIHDLETLPERIPGARYEIIDGELHVTTSPSSQHQIVGFRIGAPLQSWSDRTGAGVVIPGAGVIFSDVDAAEPDLVWVRQERLAGLLDEAGHLRGAPELIVEVLSPGPVNELRDRDLKLAMYSRHGVLEYWIVDWRARSVAVYRRERDALRLAVTLLEPDTLTSPLFPGLSLRVAGFFANLP